MEVEMREHIRARITRFVIRALLFKQNTHLPRYRHSLPHPIRTPLTPCTKASRLMRIYGFRLMNFAPVNPGLKRDLPEGERKEAPEFISGQLASTGIAYTRESLGPENIRCSHMQFPLARSEQAPAFNSMDISGIQAALH